MKNQLLALTASLVLVGSMSASVNNSTTKRVSNNLEVSRTSSSISLIAREKEPKDDRGGRREKRNGLDDPKGHKLAPQVAREKEPGDDRGHDGDGDEHHRGRRGRHGNGGPGLNFA
jgi:hypothetical protein